ncbi:MAG TPA: papain-like cysteine protease family protein [Candidatus Elarobacter sp.]|nr:papain-like cysteine protease family protein [Candidatus Elarobacter sp.]
MQRVWDAAVDLVLERQIGLNWCWAATAKGIVDYYGGPKLPQCRYATHFLDQAESCCDGNEQSPRCDVACDVDSVLRHFGLFAPPPFRRAVHLATLRRELERDRPVVALMQFRDGTVHALAITAVDVAEQRIGYSDPWYGPQPDSRDAHEFSNDYEGGGRWIYTILTRPPRSQPDAAISFLHDEFGEEQRWLSYHARRTSTALNLDVYVIGPGPLAAGEDPQTAERLAECTVSLEPAPRDDPSRLERVLLGMRDDIDARRARGFNVRLLRVPSVMLTALWFVREDALAGPNADAHFVPVEPAPYFLEAGQEYTLREFRELLVEPARHALRSHDINRAFIERLDRETEHAPGQ